MRFVEYLTGNGSAISGTSSPIGGANAAVETTGASATLGDASCQVNVRREDGSGGFAQKPRALAAVRNVTVRRLVKHWANI